ncbi:MAG: alpha-L-glutamate ligase-like protein [Gammaproteobacteria bacterium]|nr:alpha-L-glutamate ligase-like protein [Gammaproteobacteria bacterium]
MLCSPLTLSRKGVLGMNKRNVHYISRYNPRKLYQLVDDKLMTKKLALESNIAVPKLLGVVSTPHEIAGIYSLFEGEPGFVIKPAQGSGGRGIIVITEVREGRFYKPNKEEVTATHIKDHVSNILGGLFTLGGHTDVAMVEGLIKFDPVFEGYSHEGVPDVRLIVLKGFPVMGMLRLSTRASDGKANLHQGAIGIGLDIATGHSIAAVQFDRPIVEHPDTGKLLDHIQVPHWDRLLNLAAGCYEMSGLGYLGTDMVLDVDQGPLLLELNARPGLAIQMANKQGILPRLKRVEALEKPHKMTVTERVDYVKKYFSHRIK